MCAGLVGGLGVAPGGNIGDGIAVFEEVHGSAPDIAGKGLANPTALLLSAIMMLEYIGEVGIADHVRKALFITFEDGVRTKDLGGGETTEEFTNAVIENLEELEIPLLSSAPPIRISTELHKEVVAVEGVAIGYDVFIKYNGGIPRVPKKIGKFKLELIGNRGTTIFP